MAQQSLLPDTDDPRELAKSATRMAVEALIKVVNDPLSSDKAIIAAANSLLDRAHGKSHQSHEIRSDMTLNIIMPIEAPPNSLKHANPTALESGSMLIEHEST